MRYYYPEIALSVASVFVWSTKADNTTTYRVSPAMRVLIQKLLQPYESSGQVDRRRSCQITHSITRTRNPISR
jgi:hypothetical protein